MGIPYEVFLGAVGVVALVAVAAWRGARASRRRGLATRIALLAIVAGLAVAVVSKAPLLPWEQPLVAGGSSQSGGPNLVASSVGANVGADRVDYYAYSPGSQIRNVISLANRGAFPLTVLGLDTQATPGIESVELRPAPVGIDVSTASLQPFAQTEIASNGEAEFALVITIGRCAGMAPVPTLSSSSELHPIGSSTAIGYGALASISEVHVRYAALGLIRTATIPLTAVQAVAGPENVTGCPV